MKIKKKKLLENTIRNVYATPYIRGKIIKSNFWQVHQIQKIYLEPWHDINL